VEASGEKIGINGTTSTATPMTIKLNVSKMRLILVKDIINTFVSGQKTDCSCRATDTALTQ
jgi:hypothetical protein